MIGLAEIETGMTRGGTRKNRQSPERRCIALGESTVTNRLVRFVLSPDGRAVPDVAGKLPGRGAWLTARRDLVDQAVKKKLFSRAFRQQVTVDPNLADLLERLLAERLIATISLARRAGAAVTGAEKVRSRITSGAAAVLIQAHDGSPDGLGKIARLAEAAGEGRISRLTLLDSAELGLAFGREFAIHAALDAGGFATRATAEGVRLSGLRSGLGPDGTADDGMTGLTGDTPATSGIEDKTGPMGGSLEQDNP